MLSSKLQRYFPLFIIALVVVSRLPTLFFPILDSHEANYAVQTAIWMDGGIPYVDFVESKSLLIHMWYAWIFKIFGTYNMSAVHIADMFLVIATVAGIFFFTRYTLGERTARWSALLYAVAQSMYDLNDFLSTNTETLMNAFAVFGAYVFFKSMREDRPTLSLLAGITVGISVLAKFSGISLLMACMLSLFWFWKEQREHHWNRYVEEGVLLFIGIMFPATLFVSHVVDVGGMNGLLRWTVVENLQYSQLGISIGDLLLRSIIQTGRFLLATAWLWILAGWAVIWFARRHRWRTEVVFHAAWIVFTIPMIMRGGRFFAHYYLQFLPPLTILAALGIVSRWLFYLRSRSVSPRNRKFLQAAFILLVFVIPYSFFLWLHFYEVGKLKENMVPVQNIARAVKQYTTENDRVFVWGNDSDIYFFSRRKPASRFIHCSYLSGIKEGYEYHPVTMKRRPDFNAWIMLKKDFERRPPRVIVDMSSTGIGGYDKTPISGQLYLANYLSDGFKKAKTYHAD